MKIFNTAYSGLPRNHRRLPYCSCHPQSLSDQILWILMRIGYVIHSFFNSCHPTPLFLMAFSCQIEICIIWLYPKDLRELILILMKRFDGCYIFKWYFFCCIAVKSFLLKTIKMCSGEDHPTFTPLFYNPWSLYKVALFYFVFMYIDFRRILLLHRKSLYN